MGNSNQRGSELRPHTEVLTRGFDPRLSVGSATTRRVSQFYLRFFQS